MTPCCDVAALTAETSRNTQYHIAEGGNGAVKIRCVERAKALKSPPEFWRQIDVTVGQ